MVWGRTASTTLCGSARRKGCPAPLLGSAPPAPSGSLATLSTWLEVDSHVLQHINNSPLCLPHQPPLLPTPRGDGLRVTGLPFLGRCIAHVLWMVCSCPPLASGWLIVPPMSLALRDQLRFCRRGKAPKHPATEQWKSSRFPFHLGAKAAFHTCLF